MVLGTCLPAAAQSSDADLTSALQKGLDTYLATRAEPEHISAASLSILLKSAKTTSTSPPARQNTRMRAPR